MAAELEEQPEQNESGLYINRSQDRITITWNKLRSSFHHDKIYSLQLRLYPTGAIEISYAEVPQDIRTEIFRTHVAPMMIGIIPDFKERQVAFKHLSTGLPFIAKPNQGVIDYHRIDFLDYLDEVYQPTAYFILGASLFILIVFPYFFRLNLDRPLNDLLTGVKHIMDGRLATSIPVSQRDEIGYLAASFNEMASAQKNLVQTLEDKVAQRSSEVAEYAAQNARLEERNHLSRELHDAVSQTLFSANLIADTLPDLLENKSKEARSAVQNIQRLNKDALVEMRHLLQDLRPQKLDSHPFGHLLKNIVEATENNFSITIKCDIESDIALPSKVQLTFYRVAQECLNNAAKHAQADEIKVYFDGLEEQSMLTITDNGKGFDLSQIPAGHMGLQIMEERVQEIGGTLEIVSEIDIGTSITAIWFSDDTTE